MNKTFGWKEWDNHLLHFRGKPIKILEIGVYKGEAMEKFAEVFLESNKDAEYYGIDTWEGSPEYVEIDFKEIEKAALGRKEASSRKNNIHFIKKESVIALPELVIKNLMFDIIFIDASHTAKDVLYDSTLAVKLLNVGGIVIFDDYLWQKLEPIIFTPKPAIDSILNIFKDQLNILYMGYQVIAKKVDPKFFPKQTEKTIIDGFISLIDKYWFDNNIKEQNILLNLKELPDIKPVYIDFEKIQIREIDGIEIFYTLNLERFMFKYTPLRDVHEELKNKTKNSLKINDLVKIFAVSEFDKYTLFNTINSQKIGDFYNRSESNPHIKIYTGHNTSAVDTFYKNESKILYNKNLQINFISVKDFIYNKDNINNLLDKVKNDNYKTYNFSGHHIFKYLDLSKMYNNILLQVLILKHTLNITGNFELMIEVRYDFINDLLILLNFIFDKVYLYITSNKIGRLSINIKAVNFLGIDDNLYNKIYDVIINTDKEIISIFDSKYIYLNCESMQNSIFNQTKKIINTLSNNNKLIYQNINKVELSFIKRTINDVMTYLINKNN
jgi:predicted O-methyltransferase YrrM